MALSDGGVAVTIAKKDLRQRLRDRTAFLIGILLPFALASILSLTLGDVAQGDLDLRIGLVDLDGGVAANGFEEALRSADIGAVHELRDRSTAERRAEEGDLDAVFVLPEGLSSSATTGRGGSIEMIGSPDSDLGPLVATSFARSYAARWGNLTTTLLTVALLSLAATGAAMLFGALMRTEQQAGSVGVFVGLVLAALGGAMVPLEVFPPVMERIAHLTPHAWAIGALTDAIVRGSGPAQAWRDLVVLAAYAAVLFAVAVPAFRKSLMGTATRP